MWRNLYFPAGLFFGSFMCYMCQQDLQAHPSSSHMEQNTAWTVSVKSDQLASKQSKAWGWELESKEEFTGKLWFRVPNAAFERWNLRRPLDGIRLSRLLPSLPAAGKPLTKISQRKYFGGDFVGFIPVPAQRDESGHLAAGLTFSTGSFQNPAMEQARPLHPSVLSCFLS